MKTLRLLFTSLLLVAAYAAGADFFDRHLKEQKR